MTIEDMISSLVSRIVYVRGREMGLTDEEKKRCLDGNSSIDVFTGQVQYHRKNQDDSYITSATKRI